VSIRLAIAGLAVMLGFTALAAAATIVVGRADPIGAPRLHTSRGRTGSGELTVAETFPPGDLNPSSPRPGLADAHPAR
jgi:hypothetical protein